MAQQATREEKPPCFGRVHNPPNDPGWEANSPECAGGVDPSYKGENGSHVRAPCLFFNSCGAISQAKKVEAVSNTIDPRLLVRPPLVQQQPTTTTPSVPMTLGMQKFAGAMAVQQQQLPKPQPQQPAMIQPQVQQLTPQQILWLQQQQQAMSPVPYGYQQMMPVNYMMPAYLSVPEGQQDGYWKMFGRTVFRSMGKSLGHSVAHLFDSVSFGTPKLPGGG